MLGIPLGNTAFDHGLNICSDGFYGLVGVDFGGGSTARKAGGSGAIAGEHCKACGYTLMKVYTGLLYAVGLASFGGSS